MLFCFVLVLILRHKILYQKLAINVNKSNLTSCGARVAANNINIAEKPISHNVFGLFLDFIPQSSLFSSELCHCYYRSGRKLLNSHFNLSFYAYI